MWLGKEAGPGQAHVLAKQMNKQIILQKKMSRLNYMLWVSLSSAFFPLYWGYTSRPVSAINLLDSQVPTQWENKREDTKDTEAQGGLRILELEKGTHMLNNAIGHGVVYAEVQM